MRDILERFQPISLEEMQSVKLMNRVDTKYLVPRSMLPQILERLCDRYSVQTNAGRRSSHYHTLYYDTPDVVMYRAHHDQKLHRQKLRARIYCDTQECFCEIKTKNNKRRTKKKRLAFPLQLFDNMLSINEIRHFVEAKLWYNPETVFPQVENEFDRITLVNHNRTERLTIDLNLHFTNRVTQQSADLPFLSVIELKQDGALPSFFKNVMRDLRVQPKRISKYCLATILTNPAVKSNRFKRKLRYIEKICNVTI
ncbi:MAG: polyphosphate polymerase domain-containing protein [Bacteroidales bacterium]|nr:polyphosphate polymerase domain-containing protein [Bacteroidales bacterium]